ncbi:Gx transporter family protein [Enterocloster bolteae]|uniref:Gx transporter family protein n=1 Tax=Enterocloster bolteae TaxID=208479 RepID=UPI0028DBB844|nr:Gx transporter family protein [Enterocloster bolteae]
MNVKKLTRLAMLTGVALIIFVIELQIPNPFPIPGIKLGLANIITVYALYNYRAREVMMIVFARIFLAAVFSGNMMALLYSFSGSVLCLTGMLILKRIIDEKHIWIASVFGAVLHNIGQIAIAVIIMGFGVLAYLPFLLVSGCLAGAFTGGCAQLIVGRLKESMRYD